MNTATLTRDPFMPQQPRVRGRAIALAVLAHVLLILGLWFGVDWRSDEPASVAAELWSATPQAAAPRAEEPPPTSPPVLKKVEPVVKPTPTPPPPEPKSTPRPPEPVAAKPPTPTLPDPQIAIEKAKREEAKREAAEQEAAKKAQREKAEKAEQAAEAEREKQALALKKKGSRKAESRAGQATSQAAGRPRPRSSRPRRTRPRPPSSKRWRVAQMKRMAGMVGATGGANDTGTALRSSAPSANYAGRVVARIKPNIVFTDSVDGNPRAVVEVRLAPDGTIIGKRLVQSSGSRPWDEAVLRAIERTEMLPLDNGRAPPVFEIGFRPRDL